MSSTAPTDAEILRLLIQMPEQGIHTLQIRYGGLILRIASRILAQCPQDVEEVAADILALTWRQANSLLNENRTLAPWLIVTTRNRAIDRWRSLARKGALSLDEDVQLVADPCQTDEEEIIGELVQEMEEPDREIFLRRYYRLETAKEIGESLGMKPNTVNVRLVRGREKLKRKYLARMGKEQQYDAE